MRIRAAHLTLALLSGWSGVSCASTGPRAVTGLVKLQAGTTPVVFVGTEITLEVSIRGSLPAGELRWTLLLADVEQASGTIGRVNDVPVRDFDVVTLVEHQDFVLALREGSVGTATGALGAGLVRELHYEVWVRSSESGAVVAKATGVVKATCEATDRHRVCRSLGALEVRRVVARRLGGRR